MKMFVVVLIATLACPSWVAAQAVDEPAVWRGFAEKLEPGTTLKVRLASGQRFTATLLQVSSDAMTLQMKTRVPVPPQDVRFADVRSLEVDRGKGASLAKAVAIGAGVGAGAFFALMALAFAVLDD
jgi:hypothetical protein